MNKQELIAKVNSVLAEEFEVDEAIITPEANIKQTLELDSLSLVDMVALIDNEFAVKIPTTELSKLQTFEALYNYLEEKTNA